MISLLLPSRKRPEILRRMLKSVQDTVHHQDQVEIIVRFDDDDISSVQEARKDGLVPIVGPRLREMTIYWNECFDFCSGDIVCQANDDIIFKTRGWDEIIEKAFAEVEDRILLAHGNDVLGHGGNFGPHPFVSRRWVETLGYFIPPYFCSDFGDAWVNEIADMLGRRRFLPFDIEHNHFSLGMCEADENTKERLARHTEDNPDAIYYSPEKVAERQQDANKLAKLMTSHVDNAKWVPPRAQIRGRGQCQKCESLSTVYAMGYICCNACGASWEPQA